MALLVRGKDNNIVFQKVQGSHLHCIANWSVREIEIDLDIGPLLVGALQLSNRMFLKTIS
jgi:hypothetical protein